MFRIGPLILRQGLRVSKASPIRVWTRYQTNKSLYDDEKLRKIIESTNLGRSDRDKIEPPEVVKEIQSRAHRQAKDIQNDFSSTGSTPVPQQLPEIEDLPSAKEEKRSQLARKLEIYIDSLQDTIFTATRALNDVTGYSSVEKLKASIDILEHQLKDAKDEVKKCKAAYSDAIQNRSKLQREVNELLTRKHSWTSGDLERFTDLYRNDHTNEQLETETELRLNEAEQKVDAIQLKLTQLILTRYHEEQIWSDKIRRSSTWGTWILTGINIFLFILATFLVEPWKRKRLVGSFEDKVKDVLMNLEREKIVKSDDEPASTEKNKETPSDLPSESLHESKLPPVPLPTQPYTFSLSSFRSWHDFTQKFWTNYEALKSRDITLLQFDKTELGVLVGMVTILGGCLGSAITIYLGK